MCQCQSLLSAFIDALELLYVLEIHRNGLISEYNRENTYRNRYAR